MRISALLKPARTIPPAAGDAGALAAGGNVTAPAITSKSALAISSEATVISRALLIAGTRRPESSARSTEATIDHVPGDRRSAHWPDRAPPKLVVTRD